MQGKVVGIHGGVRAQRAGDDRAVGVDAGLVGRNLASIHELLHVGVVAGHADERTLVEQVGARVAHVGDGERVVFDVGAGGRASHAGFAQAVEGGLDHGGVGGLDGCCQARGVGGLRRRLGDGLDGDGGCHLAGGVSSHAVAHAKERRLHQIGVLIVRAYASDVGAGAPHKLRGGAGVVGRVGLDALVGQRLKAHGRAGIFELCLHGGDIDFGCVAGGDGVGIVSRLGVGDVRKVEIFGYAVGGIAVLLRLDSRRLGRRKMRRRGRALGLSGGLGSCGGRGNGLFDFGRRCGCGCRLACRGDGEYRRGGLGGCEHGSALVNRLGDGLGKVSRCGRCLRFRGLLGSVRADGGVELLSAGILVIDECRIFLSYMRKRQGEHGVLGLHGRRARRSGMSRRSCGGSRRLGHGCGLVLLVDHRRFTFMTTSPIWTSSPSRSVAGSTS